MLEQLCRYITRPALANESVQTNAADHVMLKRVFNLDLEHSQKCDGELKIIAAILQQPVIEKILIQVGLQAHALPRSAVRGKALQAV